jgi:histidinol dehydrogenase
MSRSGLLYCGTLDALPPAIRTTILDRGGESRSSVADVVRRIVERVRVDGDAALRELARELDGVDLERLDVPRTEWKRAFDRIPVQLRDALQ